MQLRIFRVRTLAVGAVALGICVPHGVPHYTLVSYPAPGLFSGFVPAFLRLFFGIDNRSKSSTN